MTKRKNSRLPSVSIVVATFRNPLTLRKTLQGLLAQEYPSEFEIIVIDDGSGDQTPHLLKKEFAKNPRIQLILFPKNQGVCKARNAGIARARYPIVINMDHDCIPEKNWLQQMVTGFDSEKVGVVTAYGGFGGTSTAFRKPLLEKVGGYDEDYRYYREDTDLSFKIMDLGYQFRFVNAPYFHDHIEVAPEGITGFLRHVWKRLSHHQNDVLLWKKHPTKLCAEFLHVQWGFIVNPISDFKVTTGLWQPTGKLGLSSPRGITFLSNKTPLHTILIILGGLGYVIAVKIARLIGSIRFRKLLL